mmetsp:Transcript_93949/g.302235  ORF Transcript_93949/g.302235 Transcript_93949/m.302235 type:complete len:437 (-) Transcript_93949:25-1335(-)
MPACIASNGPDCTPTQPAAQQCCNETKERLVPDDCATKLIGIKSNKQARKEHQAKPGSAPLVGYRSAATGLSQPTGVPVPSVETLEDLQTACLDCCPSHNHGFLNLAVRPVLVAREVLGGEGSRDSPAALLLQHQRTELRTEVTHLPPELPPRIPDNPVLALLLVSAPSNNGDDMIDSAAGIGGDATGVLQKRHSVNSARDRASVEDLLLHRCSARDGAVVGDRSIRIAAQRSTEALRGKGRASPRDILGLASPICVGAEALLALGRACHVRIGSVIGDPCTSLLRNAVQPLVRPIHRATMAAANVATIQYVLHGQGDLDALAFARDLDAVTQGRHAAVGPAGAAILRNVLVQGLRAVVLSIHVAPIVLRRERLVRKQLVRRHRRGIAAPDHAGLLSLLPIPQRAPELDGHSRRLNAEGKSEGLGDRHGVSAERRD